MPAIKITLLNEIDRNYLSVMIVPKKREGKV
jgi:hypothetical protein